MAVCSPSSHTSTRCDVVDAECRSGPGVSASAEYGMDAPDGDGVLDGADLVEVMCQFDDFLAVPESLRNLPYPYPYP